MELRAGASFRGAKDEGLGDVECAEATVGFRLRQATELRGTVGDGEAPIGRRIVGIEDPEECSHANDRSGVRLIRMDPAGAVSRPWRWVAAWRRAAAPADPA